MQPAQDDPGRRAAGRGRVPGTVWWAVPLVAYLLLNALYYTPYLVDDAFISFRYARNLVEGAGLVFNAGERVEGFSNFGWVLVAAAVQRLGWPLIGTVKALGVVAAMGTGWITWIMARRVLAGGPAPTAGAIAAAAFVCLNTSLAIWSQAGLETAFFALLLVASVTRYETELVSSERHPWSAVWFGLAWLTRPEAPAYGLYFLARRWAVRRGPRPWRNDLVWGGVLASFVVPFEVFGLAYYGHLLPNTHTAKVGGGLRALAAWDGGTILRGIPFRFFLEQGWGMIVLVALAGIGAAYGFLKWGRRLPTAAWAPLVAGLVFAAYAWIDWMPRYRLMVPVLPFVALALGHGVSELAGLRIGSRALRAPVIVAVVVGILGYGHHQATAAYAQGRPEDQPQGRRDVNAARGFWPGELLERFGEIYWPLEEDAVFALHNAAPGETIVISDIGFPGFLARNPIFDVRGLVTLSSARARAGGGAEAREEMIDELLRRRPAYIMLPRRRGGFSRAVGWVDELLRADPRLAADYETREMPHRVYYMRRDRAAFDTEARRRAALEDVPAYRRSWEARVSGPGL